MTLTNPFWKHHQEFRADVKTIPSQISSLIPDDDTEKTKSQAAWMELEPSQRYHFVRNALDKESTRDFRKHEFYEVVCDYIVNCRNDWEEFYRRCLLSDVDPTSASIVGLWWEQKYAFVRKKNKAKARDYEFPNENLRSSLWNFYIDDRLVENKRKVVVYSKKHRWSGFWKVIGDHVYVTIDEGDESRQQSFSIFRKPILRNNQRFLVGISIGVGASEAELPIFPIMSGRSVLARVGGPIAARFYNNPYVEFSENYRRKYCEYVEKEDYIKDDNLKVVLDLLNESESSGNIGTRMSVRFPGE